MRHLFKLAFLALAPAAFPATGALAQHMGPAELVTECGGSFPDFLSRMEQAAVAQGHDPQVARQFFQGLREDPKVLRMDRAQGVFQLDFLTFSRRVISQNRIVNGRANLKKYAAIFDRIEAEYGVSRGVITAFWALETDYGQVQGDFNTANSLATLAHDCRRPELFQPQLLAALTLYEHGDFDPDTTTGAWAGEIGMVQMLPEDILENGIDGDGDGHVKLKTSVPDALMSGGRMLRSLGWRPNEPWLQEVTVPSDLDWSLTGTQTKMPVSEWKAMGVSAREGSLGAADLPASILMPMGYKGPAFIAYPNFHVFLEWNQSFTYVVTAAYFATRLEGAQIYDAGNPDPGLSGDQMKELQRRLEAMGYDVGEVDGILGAMTRKAVRAEQTRLGLVVDGWPTAELLGLLG